jgi:tetratricopeptide (TPR) repeat protein
MATIDDALRRALQHHQAGELDLADELYRQILADQPQHPDALHLRGLVRLQRGDPAAAIQAIAAAVSLNDRQPAYHNNLGEAYRASGQYPAAKQCYLRALALAPHNAAAHNNLGLVHLALGELPEAERQFAEAVRLQPAYPQAHLNLGNMLYAQGKLSQAIAAYEQALAQDPNMVSAHHNLGMVLQSDKRYAEAAACHRRAVALAPRAAASIGALAVSLHLLEQLDEAAAEYRHYLELTPDDAAAHMNLATVLHRQRRFAEADAEYERAAALGLRTVELFIQRGTCTQSMGELARAAEFFRTAIEIDPSRDEPHFRLGAALLAAGNLAEGWPEYEWRLKRVARDFAQPLWDGRDLGGKRIVLYAEGGQGLGDTLQFVRFERLVRSRGGEVMLEVQPALVPLLTQSGYADVVPTGAPLPKPCDVQAAMMSLPRILGTSLDSIPADVPYLSARSDLVEAWSRRLAPYPALKVGIHWHGSQIAIGDGRVVPLAQFESLAQIPGVTLISLQKKEGLDQLAAVADRFTVLDFSGELDEEHGALQDTAAIMKNLDLVVTNDTVTAHLAGALAVPVWVALPYSAEWRWLTVRDDSPWYPTMRLFRQMRLDDWSTVFQGMADKLAALAAARGGA